MAQSSKTAAKAETYNGSPIFQASRANTEANNIYEGINAKDYSKFFQSVEQDIDSKVCLLAGQEPLADIKAIARDILEMATSHQEKNKKSIPKNFNAEELSKRLHEADAKKKQKILVMQREAYLQETAQMGDGVKANAVSQKILQSKNYLPIHLRTAYIIQAKQDKCNRLLEEKLQNEEPIPCFKPKIEKTGEQKRSFSQFVNQMDGWVAKKNLRIEEQQNKLNELEAKQMTFKPAINQKSLQLAKQLKEKQDKKGNYNQQKVLISADTTSQSQRRKDSQQPKKVSQQENKENIPARNQEFQSQENTIAEIVKEFDGLRKTSTLLEHSSSSASLNRMSEDQFKNQINHLKQGRFSEMNGVVVTDDNHKQRAENTLSAERIRNIKKSASFSKLEFLENYSKYSANKQAHTSRSISPLLPSKTGTNRSINDQQYRFFLAEKNKKMDYSVNVSHPNLDFIIELLHKKDKQS